jgi:hypothetical protein
MVVVVTIGKAEVERQTDGIIFGSVETERTPSTKERKISGIESASAGTGLPEAAQDAIRSTAGSFKSLRI